MKKFIAILSVAISCLTVFQAFAQTNAITTTNVVTVTVTNVVPATNVVTVLVTNVITITNVLAKADAAPGPIVKPPKYPWESSISAGLTLTRGNSDTLLATGGVVTDKKTPADEIKLGADGAYGTSGSEKNVDSVHTVGQYNHLFTDWFYAYARVEATHDGVADLQYRVNVGPGAGYYFLKETNTTLAGELGSTFVNQRLGSVDDNYATFRFAERFEHKFQNFGARIWQNVEILPQVDKINNFLINAELGVESSITKTISLKTFVVDNFNNEPASGHKKNDVKLVSGISYKF